MIMDEIVVEEMDGGELGEVEMGGGGEEGTAPNYTLCYNESLANITISSIFCSNNYTYPIFPPQDKDTMDIERIVSLVVPALFGIIFVVGLFGNALVVVVVASNAQMRNTTNILIINLAVADLLFIIFCVPFTAADYVLTYWPFGLVWCKMVQYLIIVTAYVSVYTLVIMSVDRFLAVVYPVTSISIRTEMNTYLAIGITWVVILLSCLPVLSAHGLSYFDYAYQQHAACTFNQDYNHAAFQISFLLTSYAIPLTIICLLYFGMLVRLWKSGAAGSGRSIRGKKRVTRMVVVVVGVFAVCWLPIQVVLVLKSLKLYPITDLSIAIQITAHVLGYMNSCVNPLIYSVLSENFRKAFRKAIACRGPAPSPHTKPRPSHCGEELVPLKGDEGMGRKGSEGRENPLLIPQEPLSHHSLSQVAVAFNSNNGTTTTTTTSLSKGGQGSSSLV